MTLARLNDLFPTAKKIIYPEFVDVPGITSTHGHGRDTDAEKDGRAELIIPYWAEVCEDVLSIGNTATALTTSALARPKKAQWNRIVPLGTNMRIHVAGLMTETTDPADVVAGYDKPIGDEDWLTMKMFIRAASNSNHADVDDISKMIPVLKAMTYTKFVHKKRPMTLSVHLERKWNVFGTVIKVEDREWSSMERDLYQLFKEVPDAHIIVCHVSDARTIELIRQLRSLGYNIWGEIAPHYTIWCNDDLYEGPGGGTQQNAHLFCLPIFKKESDKRALLSAMTSGEPWWIYGPDGACWGDDTSQEAGVKINSNGFILGGQTQIERANISYIIEKFVEAGKLEFLDGYLSHNGRDALGLPRSQNTKRFVRHDWKVPMSIERQSPYKKLKARVAMGGQLRHYWPQTLQVAA